MREEGARSAGRRARCRATRVSEGQSVAARTGTAGSPAGGRPHKWLRRFVSETWLTSRTSLLLADSPHCSADYPRIEDRRPRYAQRVRHDPGGAEHGEI